MKLLQEYYELCPDGMCPDLLTEREKKEIANGAMYLTGRIQTADKQNGNGRVYPFEVLQREVDNYKKIVADNRACGELDHPDDSVVNLKNVSHMIVDCWWEGKDVMGKMKVLVRESMGKTVVESDFQLICFDIVSEPSTPNAFVHPDKQTSSPIRMRENKQNKIDNLFTKILGD
jgi:hypothetical protein